MKKLREESIECKKVVQSQIYWRKRRKIREKKNNRKNIKKRWQYSKSLNRAVQKRKKTMERKPHERDKHR